VESHLNVVCKINTVKMAHFLKLEILLNYVKIIREQANGPLPNWILDSSVGIAIRLRDRRQRNGVRFLAREKDSAPLHNMETDSGFGPASYTWYYGYRGVSPGVQ
jgi:hypothetical protein